MYLLASFDDQSVSLPIGPGMRDFIACEVNEVLFPIDDIGEAPAILGAGRMSHAHLGA